MIANECAAKDAVKEMDRWILIIVLISLLGVMSMALVACIFSEEFVRPSGKNSSNDTKLPNCTDYDHILSTYQHEIKLLKEKLLLKEVELVEIEKRLLPLLLDEAHEEPNDVFPKDSSTNTRGADQRALQLVSQQEDLTSTHSVIEEMKKWNSVRYENQINYFNDMLRLLSDNNQAIHDLSSFYSDRVHQKVQVVLDTITKQVDLFQEDFAQRLFQSRRLSETSESIIQKTVSNNVQMYGEIQNNLKQLQSIFQQIEFLNEFTNQKIENMKSVLSSIIHEFYEQIKSINDKIESEKNYNQNSKNSLYHAKKHLHHKNERDLKKIVDLIRNIEFRNRKSIENTERLILLDVNLAEQESLSDRQRIHQIKESVGKLNESSIQFIDQCLSNDRNRVNSLDQYLKKMETLVTLLESNEKEVETENQLALEAHQEEWKKLRGTSENTYRFQSTTLQKYTEETLNSFVSVRKIFDEHINKMEVMIEKQTTGYQNKAREGLSECRSVQSTIADKYEQLISQVEYDQKLKEV